MSTEPQHVYEAPDGLIYVTHWSRRPGYDVYDLTVVKYDVRGDTRESWYWFGDEWVPVEDSGIVKPVFSLSGPAAHTLCHGRPYDLVQQLTDLLSGILPQ